MTEIQSKRFYIRAKIITLFELGWTNAKIAAYLNVNKNTVSLWTSTYTNSGTINEKQKSGRKRKTTDEENCKIIDIVNKYEKETKKHYIIDNINEELDKINIHLCNNTIINRMKAYKFNYSYPSEKPLLTEKHKIERLKWALENYNTDWFNVIFSDETTIVKDKSFSKKLWIGPETDSIKRTVKHSIKRNLYGCISVGGLVTFDIFTENMNSDKYIEILKTYFLDIYKKNSEYIYQQDNSPIHTSAKTRKFFEENNIKVMKWPSNSPDLNPIENLWYLLKVKLYDDIITVDSFTSLIAKRLTEINYEHIFNMIASMPIRICQVIANNGDSIDY